MNRVPVIVRNPAYVEEVELDEDEVNPADLIPLVSGNTPIVTVPASEDENVAEDVVDDGDEDEDEEMEMKMKRWKMFRRSSGTLLIAWRNSTRS